MKKQLFIIALASYASLISAVTTEELADRDAKYIAMEQGHKAKWFDFEKDYHVAKFTLIKNQHKQLFDLKRKAITELGKTKDVNAYLANTLNQMIELHKKQLDEWASFAKTWSEKGHTQYEAEKAKVEQFQESIEEPEEVISNETSTEATSTSTEE